MNKRPVNYKWFRLTLNIFKGNGIHMIVSINYNVWNVQKEAKRFQ